MIYHLTRATRLLSFYLLIAVAIGLSLLRLFLFTVEFYKKDLEKKIFELTSIPVEIGKLKANLRGINPEVILNDIHILATDEQGNPSIKLEQVRVGIDLTQLLSTHQLLPSSWLTLVGAKLSIKRNEDGSISVVGLNSDDSEQPLWLLRAGRYEVLKSEITWLDQQGLKLPITFHSVDLLIKNDADAQSHEVHVLTQLPAHYGDKLRMSMSLQGNLFEAESLNGLIYVEGDAINMAEIFVGELPFGINIVDPQKAEKNESSFKLWSQWEKSSLKSLSGSIQAKNVVLNQKERQKKLDINHFDTEFNVSLKEAGWKFGVKDFALTTEEQEWPVMEFSISANRQLTHLAASVINLELQELTQLIDFFSPLDKENQALVSRLDLKGQLKNFSVYADKENSDYAVNGDFKNIFVNADSGFPQLKNLTGTIKGTNENGNIKFFSKNGSVFFPNLFRKAISLENLAGSIEWLQQTDNWFVNSERLLLDTKDFETESRLSLIIPKNEKPVFIDLQTSFSKMRDVSSVTAYYPVAIMKKKLVDWLDNAFVSGEINKGDLLVYGELNKFPFLDGQGVFELLFQAKDVELNYSPQWPQIKNMDAEVLFTKDALSVDITGGKTQGMEIMDAFVNIPSFVKNPHIQIKGECKGRIVDGLVYLQQTPLHESADQVLDAITPKGLTQLSLDMEISLTKNTELKLDAVAQFKKSELTINAIDLNVTDIEGELKFTEKGFFSDNIIAHSLGYPLTVDVESEAFKTVINVEGETNFLQLKKQFSFLDSELITEEQITGLFAYSATMNLVDTEGSPAELSIKTDLLGVGFGFPGSLKKQAEEEKVLRLDMPLNKEELLPISVNYNDELKAAINLDSKQSKVHSAHFIYGNSETSFPEQKGIMVHINQEKFDASEWMGLAKLALSGKEDSELQLNNLVLKAKELYWEGISIGSFELILQRLEQQWQGNILSSFAKGGFIIPFNQFTENNIKLEMEMLNLTQLMALKMPADKINPENMPLIDVVSQQLLWKTTNLGRLDIATEKLSEGVRFKHVNVISKDYNIKLNGDWIKTDEGSVTSMHGDFSSKDFGKVLSQLDITDDIKETHGNLDFFAAWQGLPYQVSLANLDAEIELDLKDGRISSIEPGFGRLLGLVAMGQWVKRLSLDFSDIFKDGLSFDKITGRFKLGKGILSTRDLLVDAIPASISIRGGVDLREKTINQRIQVVPKSSSAIPIAGPIVGGIAGAITQVIDKDYKEGYFFGSEYEVSGQWDDYKVTPLYEQDGLIKKTWTGLTDFSWMKEKAKD